MDEKLQHGLLNTRSPLLGCIADDFTGATDIAGSLFVEGMQTRVRSQG
jgi:hypothetical protein